MSLSVIIPTFKNVEFLSELFDSIEKCNFTGEYEVLIGIDSCEDTLKYVYENQFPINFKFFFFLENKGPYLIKNTLSDISSFDKLFFFDSDDVMIPNLLSEIDNNLNKFQLIKPKYIDFEDKNGSRVFKEDKPTFGEGVFGIKKQMFLDFGGFEDWRVAADSDFMGRLYKSKITILHTNHILFHRRIHKNSLTINPATGLASRLRSNYFQLSKNKTKNDIVIQNMKKSSYKVVDIINKNLSLSYEEINNQTEINEYEKKLAKHESISSIFSLTPKIKKNHTPTKKIDYTQVNKNTNLPISSQLSSALKKAKLENIRKNSRR